MHDFGGENGYVILQHCQKPMTCFSADGTMFAYLIWEERSAAKKVAPGGNDWGTTAGMLGNQGMKLKHFMQKLRGQ